MKTTTTLLALFFLLTVSIALPMAAEEAYPVEWIQQIGSNRNDQAYSVAVDETGNAYVSGTTYGSLGGPNFSHCNSFQANTVSCSDAFLTKFDSNGMELWSRQIGTSTGDTGISVALDEMGNAYITGYTRGNLAGTNAGRTDAFLMKFDSTGSELWRRQIGSDNYDSGFSVAVDEPGNTYITGWTSGSLEGINAGKTDAFLMKFDSSGTELWTRQFGTDDHDSIFSMTVSELGNIYITGDTSGNLAGINAGGSDAYLMKLDSAGTELWTRQIGTYDFGRSVAVDEKGYASLITYNYIVDENSRGDHFEYTDVFLTRFDPTGTELWSQEIGTIIVFDSPFPVTIDEAGNTYVGGHVYDDIISGRSDALLMKFDPDGIKLWTQQIGTNDFDKGTSITLDRTGDVYMSGSTRGNLGGTNAGDYDAFLIKFTNPVPEPTSGLLAVLASAGLLFCQRDSSGR